MTNFMIALRVLRMGCGEYGESVLKEALLPVGKIGRSAFLRAFAGGEEGIIAAIARGGYSALAEKLSVGISLSAAEKLCDKIAIIKGGKIICCGKTDEVKILE